MKSDHGFVHQSLGLIRTDNVCLWQSSGSREPMEMLSAEVLPPDELLHARANERREYFLALGLPKPGQKFRDYHRTGLALIGWDLHWPGLSRSPLEILDVVLNHKYTLRRALGRWRRPARAAPAGRPVATRCMGEASDA